MAKLFDKLEDSHIEFIASQKIFFVGTAMENGSVNVSPKGMDSFRVIAHNRIIWLNATGSGNETATHVQYNNRMTIMFCAFEGKPLILRLYGKAKVYHSKDNEYNELISNFSGISAARQIFELDLDRVQTSCGYAVPFMDFKEERTQLNSWADKQGEERIKNYWKVKNTVSIDGVESNIVEKSNL